MIDTPITQLPATSSITIRKLKGIGIETFGDFLRYFPTRYEAYEQNPSLLSIGAACKIAVTGTVLSFQNQYTRRRFTIQKAVLQTPIGTIHLTWFNQLYFSRIIQPNVTLSVAGILTQTGSQLSMKPESWEIMQTDTSDRIHTGALVPVYPEKRGLSSRLLREKMKRVLEMIPPGTINEYLPEIIYKKYKLSSYEDAIRMIHFPKSDIQIAEARHRLAFDELYIVQLSANKTKTEWQQKPVAHQFKASDLRTKKINSFIRSIPFPLTKPQQRSVTEILSDMHREFPMNRFLQGDVGSGKTVVAAIAVYECFLNGYTTLYMAPTEILAQQHARSLKVLFEKTPVRIAIQTGSKKIAQNVQADLIIGTHALISQSFKIARIGLVIIDEQHRFGVVQRKLLQEKASSPHVLTMTATPIPRTMALTLYGELDMSIIDEMPAGRIPVKTWLVPQEKRNGGYDWIRKRIIQHHEQVFIICPLIEESDHETMRTIKAASVEYEHLARKVFPPIRMALLHGKMKSEEKESVMKRFSQGEIDILVSTSVVEVGIDIPNATIMVIEGAERFGLAQLHQLRGRVGRGKAQSYCLLFTSHPNSSAHERLTFFSGHTDGISLAKYDLETRGAGEVYGTKQHGVAELQIANIMDAQLVSLTSKAVADTMQSIHLEDYPILNQAIERLQGSHIAHN